VILGEALPGHFLLALGVILGGLVLSQIKLRRIVASQKS